MRKIRCAVKTPDSGYIWKVDGGSGIRDRRGRAARGSVGLLEREEPLHEIDVVLDSVRDGRGAALLIAAPAGLGKTRLHEAALDRGRRCGLLVLRAAGAELELSFAHGVSAQLLAGRAGELPAQGAFMAQALVDLVAAHPSPGALIAVDDLHWADAASLELVLYLLHRLPGLPVGLVLTTRSGNDGRDEPLLDHIAAHPAITPLRLAPLHHEGMATLVRDELGDRATDQLIQVCAEVTAGNPFLLHELLLAIRDDILAGPEELIARARSLAPDAVTRSLRIRVGRLGREAAALGRAVAILGDQVPLRHAAALAGLRPEVAASAADRLAAAEVLLAREPLQYVHPLARNAVASDVPPAERASRHLDAARLLYAEAETNERVAAHLLLGRAEGSGWTVERLRAAAREAIARDAAASAADYLRRALAEPPASSDQREGVLAELGRAEAALGDPQAPERLRAAAELAGDPLRRATLARDEGLALHGLGRYVDAADAHRRGIAVIAEAGSDRQPVPLVAELGNGWLAAALMVPAELSLDAAPAQATAGGARTLQSALAGAPAAATLALAREAWRDGALLREQGPEGLDWQLVTLAMVAAGDSEGALELTAAVAAHAARRTPAPGLGPAGLWSGLAKLAAGRVTEAAADVEQALQGSREARFTRAARAILAAIRLEQAAPVEAERVLAATGSLSEPCDLEDALHLAVRGELRLATGRAHDALADARRAGELIGPHTKVLGVSQWRTIAARAAIAIGDRELATALAEEALALAEAAGSAADRINALWVSALAEGGEEALERLRAAAELSADAPPRMQAIRALVEFGGALRRDNRRAAARDPLTRAADLARAGGAEALASRARHELTAAGARPRRDWLISGPESLTASERRTAELAAAGHSNREIAALLFVTPKTVEYHLRNTFRKLGISRRDQIADALDVRS